MKQLLSLLLALLLCLSIAACSKAPASDSAQGATESAKSHTLTDDEMKEILLSDSWTSVFDNQANTYQFLGGGIVNLTIKGYDGITPQIDWKISDGYVVLSATSAVSNDRFSFTIKEVDGIYHLQTDQDTENEHYFVRLRDFDAAVKAEGIEFTEPVPTAVTQTVHCTLERICVDNSYTDKDNSSRKMVYVFYTVFTQDQNLTVSCKYSDLTFDSGNSYSSETYAKSRGRDMPSYYYSDYIENVYVGQPLKAVSTFLVPAGEFGTGELFSVTPYGLPSGESLSFFSADVEYFDSPEELVASVDPEGYEEMLQKRQPADAQTENRVKGYLNGYYWSFYVNSLSYEIEFYTPNRFETRVRAYNISNGGTYTVQNGFIVCTYDSNGTSIEIPYTLKENDIDLDVTDAFDVHT